MGGQKTVRCRCAALEQKVAGGALGAPRVRLGDKDRRRHGLHYGCHVRKLTVLTIGFAVGLTFAPAANAAPIPQQQGSNCDSNYSGACVPIASDVDCASGSGNGPAYVAGPVTVIGNDIYGLDNNHDGTGCES